MSNFAEIITHWYTVNKRDLPWRKTQNPYKIWLSEIILQQTRIAQGTPYYLKFIENFPTVHHLAQAPIDDVLRLWQGLGYYSRARNLHTTAKIVSENFNGIFPNTFEEIKKLKGIGEYTASAIASFAFEEAVPVLDGNVYRLISRYFGVEDDIAKSSSKKTFMEILRNEIPSKTPSVFNQGIMEFGSMQCTPTNPNCSNCPLVSTCFAFKNNLTDKLPVKSKNIVKKDRYFNYLLLKSGEKIKFLKRNDKDIWQGLYEFVLEESKDYLSENQWIEKLKGNKILSIKSFEPNKKHLLSHQNIYSRMTLIEIEAPHSLADFYTLDEIKKLPKPQLIDNFLKQYVF
jgi:A/G-specific adenine glycosylase